MAVESRLLTDSISFALTADTWAIGRGLLDGNGDPTSAYPAIIGVPSNSVDLGAFNLGIITSNRTIKQALQDLETAVNGRMFAGNNLSDLTNKATARTNLELGSAATRSVGNSGANVPVMNVINTWDALQKFSGGIESATVSKITGSNGSVSSCVFTTGTVTRWALSKTQDNESGADTGSNFVISRYSDTGVFIDNPVSIARDTGAVSLSKPLPLTSGGTGGNSLGTARTALNINNVDNTSDANKPISIAVNAALADKFDRTGGNVSGAIVATGPLSSSSFVRGSSLICTGGTGEGGQIILGYRNNTTVSGEDSSTWNMDVDNNSNFRLFTKKSDGTYTSDIITITQAGVVSIKNLTVSGNGVISQFTGSGGQYQGLDIRNNFGSSSQQSQSFISFSNENNIETGDISYINQTNGSSSFNIATTPSGSRSSDRRVTVFQINNTEATFSVPINGRAFPRRSDGADFNLIWNGQSSAPSWIIGSNNGTDFYPYNPNSVSVDKLSDIVGGNSGGYIRRSTDSNANGNLSSQLILAGDSATDDVWSSPLQIREVNKVADTQSAAAYAPGIAFHWGNRTASSIKMHSDGSFRFQQQNVTVLYRNIWANDVLSTGWFRPQGDTGLAWDGRNRQLTVADNGSTYGTVNVTGAGLNNWRGYAIGSTAVFMSDGSSCGIYQPSSSSWLVNFDSSRNAVFSQNVTAYSDERLKQNKRPITDVAYRRSGMAKAAIIYERNDKTFIGFGAQTLEPYVPEVVNTSDDIVGTKTVDYSAMIAILAVDNQILSDRIDVLENIHIDLQNKYDTLLARLEKAGL